MKANKKEIKAKLKEAIEPIIGENSSKKLDKIVLKSTKKLSDLIADFMVKAEKKNAKKIT
ncbi:hypothetical protein [Lacihabitans sp. CS3-21]|jgi:hypothetical protein|uniref:hypothetical protein n=1 Tax=Lacihabitans sp. CS3-21 TaxID=2487332 RepID=UPI0020CF64C6|nr:hypothetical protein [Lacihabitans sp. CS3-21]MCP9747028.1 hypothetical protein [Lacihabitans sp. CS3-21]